jgi:uncharacterized protein YndB with AHSA1/START domain
MSKPLPDIRKETFLNVPVAKVWPKISTSEGLASWWMKNTLVPERGTKFVLKSGDFGDSQCTLLEVIPDQKISFKWDNDWTVSFILQREGNSSTRFILIHSGWDADLKTRFGQDHERIREIMDLGWEKLIKENLSGSLNHS